MKKQKVSIVIPVYQPEKEVFEKVKEILRKQTIKAEIVENWNMPEAKSMNTGIKRAKGEIIIILAQDCIPEDKYWIEKLIKPLEDKKVIATVSDLYLPEEYWKKYPFLTRVLTVNDIGIKHPIMDARACAYRKKDLIRVGMFSEDPNVIAIDGDLYKKIKDKGKIVHPSTKVLHLHHLTNLKKIKLSYKYAVGSGRVVRKYGSKEAVFWRRLLRATPLFGMLPIIFVFPFGKHPLLFPVYLLLSPITHLIYVFGFWKGFLTG